MKKQALKIKIYKNIPPPERRYKTRRWEDLLSKMKIGDSVVMERLGLVGSLRGAALKKGFEVMTQATPDGKGWRIWRTK